MSVDAGGLVRRKAVKWREVANRQGVAAASGQAAVRRKLSAGVLTLVNINMRLLRG